MNVDLHTHTYPASDCSRISYRDYIAWCVDNAVEAVALTNHGDISDNLRLGPALAAEGVLLIDGVEISTLFGDFVIFSPDLDYLETLRAVQDAPRADTVPEDAAVVWVHPGAGGGRSGSAYYPGIEHMVAGVVDAVEVFNGSWLGDRYVRIAEQIAGRPRRGAHRRQRRPRPGGPHGLLHGAARPGRLHGRRGRTRSGSGRDDPAPAPRARAAAQALRTLLGGRHVDARGADPAARELRRHQPRRRRPRP